MSEEIVWEEPPEAQLATKGKWGRLLAPFRDRPGQWGRVPGKHNTSTSHNIRRGTFNGIGKDEFEAVIRNTENGTGDLYVRYVGKPGLKAAG
jgi:hypothetical protein